MPAYRRQHPLHGRRRERRTAHIRGSARDGRRDNHLLLRLHGLGRDDHRAGSLRGVPPHSALVAIPGAQLAVRGRRQCPRSGNRSRPAAPHRRTHCIALRREVGARRRDLPPAYGGERRPRPLALAPAGRRGGTGRPHSGAPRRYAALQPREHRRRTPSAAGRTLAAQSPAARTRSASRDGGPQHNAPARRQRRAAAAPARSLGGKRRTPLRRSARPGAARGGGDTRLRVRGSVAGRGYPLAQQRGVRPRRPQPIPTAYKPPADDK